MPAPAGVKLTTQVYETLHFLKLNITESNHKTNTYILTCAMNNSTIEGIERRTTNFTALHLAGDLLQAVSQLISSEIEKLFKKS